MEIVHAFDEKEVSRQTDDVQGFLLTNQKGGFFLAGGSSVYSKYCGSFFPVQTDDGWTMYKAIESLALEGVSPKRIRNNFFSIERADNRISERFYMNHSKTLFYEVDNFDGYANLVLDCRQMYDFSDRGRIYRIRKEADLIIVEYTKFSDDTLTDACYSVFIVIAGASEFLRNERWIKRCYEQDRQRNSNPDELYVYDAIRLKIRPQTRLVFTFSDTLEDAIRLAKNAKENYPHIKRSIETYKRSILSEKSFPEPKIEMAYRCASNSMDCLITDVKGRKGIFAGLPWYHHFWTRDEAISLNSLIVDERYEEAAQIMLRLLHLMHPDGRISNRYPFAALGCADSVGWTFRRIDDLLSAIGDGRCSPHVLGHDDLSFIKERLRFSVQQMLKQKGVDGLIRNDGIETWMDTSFEGDTREGFRIEIQALQLAMYSLMQKLCTITGNAAKEDTYMRLEEATRKKVREVFWKDPILCDGMGDQTIRPNIFLAYYAYPELLEKDEWTRCFDNALNSLWLGWGGLATIDKRNRLFTPDYTGEDNRSYHRGDSWFFINNIAAICMQDLDAKKYSLQIRKIVDASTEDILFKGILGHHSEVSSARQQISQGSQCQAWSAATYMELIKAVYG